MSFALVVGALEEVMGNRFGGDSLAVLANWRFRAMDAEEVLVKRGMAGAKLCKEG
jgi:hypothetical protein